MPPGGSSARAAFLYLGGYLSVPNIAVPQTKVPGLAQIAANLSEEAGILSTMGAGSTIPQATDPAGLMSWFEQPYDSSSSPDRHIVAGTGRIVGRKAR
jgi:hypothetical protein